MTAEAPILTLTSRLVRRGPARGIVTTSPIRG